MKIFAAVLFALAVFVVAVDDADACRRVRAQRGAAVSARARCATCQPAVAPKTAPKKMPKAK